MSDHISNRSRLVDGRLQLINVTLVAVTSVAVPATIRAMQLSLQQVDFARAVLFSDATVSQDEAPGIDIVQIDRLRSRQDYSRFILNDLASHIATDFTLCVQWDGFIINPLAWTDHFFDFDYIGAVWPQFDDGMKVGNGGFSLRSRRLLDACRDSLDGNSEAEDIEICRTKRRMLEENFGIKFADESIASQFSFERTARSGLEFGFHGVFNLWRFVGRSEFRKILTSLEPAMLSIRELRDLWWWALRNGEWRLAASLAQRMAQRRNIGFRA